MTDSSKVKKTLFIFLVVFTTTTFAQYNPGKGSGLYSTGANEIDKGWFFGIGGTYMVAYPKRTYQSTYSDTSNNITQLDYTGDPKGKFGLFAEVGKFRMNGKRVINYMDYALAYKWLRGGEDYTLETTYNGTALPPAETEGSFGDHLLSANLRVGHRFDNSDKKFMVNGLGLNLDYHLIKGRSATPQVPLNADYTDGPNSILGELHYFFAMGFKTEGRLIIMPMIETPILALWPFNHIVSTHSYFNGRFRPILFRIRFMFLSKDSKSCPKVFNPMGIDPNNQLEK